MRPAFIAGIVIGIIMMYFGYMGAAAIPGLDIGGSYYLDEFTSISGWSTATGCALATSDGANAVFSPTTRIYMQRGIGVPSDVIGAEFKFKITVAGTPGIGLSVFWLSPSEKGMCIIVKDNAIQYYNTASGQVGSSARTHQIGVWYTVTMEGSFTTGLYKIWENGDLLVTSTTMLTGWSPGAGANLLWNTGTGGGTILVDYVNVGTSGGPTGGQNYPPKVQVVVKNSDGSGASGRTVVVSQSGTEVQRGLTANNGSYPADGSYMSLTSGVTYRFYVDDNCWTERSFADNDVVTIALTLSGGGDQGDGSNPIRDLLNNPTVKQVLLYGGIGLSGLSLVGFVIPKHKERDYPPPPRYPRYYTY